MLRKASQIVIAATLVAFASLSAEAACMNKFVVQSQGNKRVVTLLTGMLTFAEASELAKNYVDKKSGSIEWLDDKGKPISTAAEFQAVRPMPVACGDKPSGTVINAVFMTFATPSKTMQVKFPNGVSVTFEEQAK